MTQAQPGRPARGDRAGPAEDQVAAGDELLALAVRQPAPRP
ncbi:hypothetical protein [Nonomuraea diastatica]|nr:hypothetical protein [Nonomuraea diastatica]